MKHNKAAKAQKQARKQAKTQARRDADSVNIYSVAREAWWRPRQQGFTVFRDQAGAWPTHDAKRMTQGIPPEKFILVPINEPPPWLARGKHCIAV